MSTLQNLVSTLSPAALITNLIAQPKTGRLDVNAETIRQDPEATFAQRLRAETAKSHQLVESTGFIKSILRGAVDIEGYRVMQAGIYQVYCVMEEELERNADHALLSRIHLPVLHRKQALAADLEFLYGEDWEQQLTMSPARQAYIDRLRWVGENAPELLIAHSYTRYLGDLSGGKVVEKIVRRSLGLLGLDGMRFFNYEGIKDRRAFKDDYRRRLNEMPLSKRQAGEVIDEANRVFGLNQGIFEELQGSWIRTLAKLATSGFRTRQLRAS